MKRARFNLQPYSNRIAVITSLFFLLTGYAWSSVVHPEHDSTTSQGLTQQRTVKGVVLDHHSDPIIGASVSIVGTTVGTISNLDGEFSLEAVPSGSKLSVSYLGFKTKVVSLSPTDSYITIVMEENTELLEEVVVVGYGAQKKVNLSGSVAAINVDEVLESRPITNVSHALSGMAAGVSVTSGNNAPGDNDATINIRGVGTLNTSSPLVIIDGAEGSISSVNPMDVESISVLKDAASAAIYGSRAANGVILITTKSGKEGKVKIEYSGYVASQSIRKTLTPVSNYADYMELVNEGLQNSNIAKVFSQEKIDEWRNDNGANPELYPNSNWIDETFRSATTTNHVVSMSGGSDKIRMYTSLGYMHDPGVMENSGFDKFSARVNVEGNIKKWLKAGVNINGFKSNLQAGNENIEDIFTYTAATTPGMVFRSSDGRYGAMNNSEDAIQSGSNNPLLRLNSIKGQTKTNDIKTRFFLTVTPLEGLDITASYSYQFQDKQKENTQNFHDAWNFLENIITVVNTGNRTSIYNYNQKTIRHFNDVAANYNKKLFEKRLNLNILAGASQEQYTQKEFSARKYDRLDDDVTSIDGATGESTTSGKSTSWAMRSFFGRINLGWEDKYLVEFNLRADGSSRFASNKRWGYFPSVSAAWRISQEKFMSGISFIDNLKIRASYGGLGNNSIKNYESVAIYQQTNYVQQSSQVIGLAQKALANSNVTWETTYIANVGVDFGLLENRLSGSLEFFNKKTKDILITLPAPGVHGTSTIPASNAATVTNKGVELSLGWRDKIGEVTYGVNGNVTYVKNKINKFKGNDYSLDRFNKDDETGESVYMTKEGQAMKAIYALKVDRIIQTEADMAIVEQMIAKNANAFAAYGKPEYGDLLYVDENKDDVIDSNDRTIVSQKVNPKVYYGMNLNAEYKNFDLGVMIQGTAGSDAYFNHTAYNTPTVRYGYQINKKIADGRWYEGRTDAKYPRLLNYSDNRNTLASNFYVKSNAYLKIKNIQLGYSIPKSILSKIDIERIRVYGSLENFFTFTKFDGFDPEVPGMKYPTMKQAVLGINVTF